MLASRTTNSCFCWFKRSCPLRKTSGGNVLCLLESRRVYGRQSDRFRVELRVKGSVDFEMRGKESVVDEKGKTSIGLVGGGGDVGRLEAMTVKELRGMMREASIPVKGTKADLVAALASFLQSKGQDEDMPATVQQPVSKNSSSKRKADDSIDILNDIPSKNSDVKQKNIRKSNLSDNKCSKHKSKSNVIEESSSTCTVTAATIKSTTGTKTSKIEQESIKSIVSEPWTVLVHTKPQAGWVAYNPKVMRPRPLPDGVKAMKLISWNVNGLRGLLKSEASSALQLAEKENFDILCLQETKMQEKDVEKIKERLIDGYDHNYWTCSISKLGYSGTAILSRIKPISVSYGLGIVDHDSEGRLVTVEFDSFYLLCAYVPNSGDGLKRLEYRIKEWDPSLSKYMKDLERSKPVILTGDLNCAHEEIDIHNPAGNRRSAGFTDEERESFNKNFLSRGFVDTFRKQHPSVVGYTYYGYRHGGRKTNKGWRLDYFLVSEMISDKVHDSYIVPDVPGSDHCPIGLILKL